MNSLFPFTGIFTAFVAVALAIISTSCLAPHLPMPHHLPLPGLAPGSSDARMKENVSSYTRGLESIEEVNPLLFDFRDTNPEEYPQNDRVVGVIAQDIEQTYPEAVFWSAINAIQELEKGNRELRSRVGGLEKSMGPANKLDEEGSPEAA